MKKPLFKRFIAYYGPHKGLLLLDLSMSLLFGVSGIFIPVMARKLMQEDVLATSLSAFITPILILCVLIIVMTVSSYVNMKWGHVLGTRMETDMRRDLFGHLQKLSFSYFDKTKTGHIMSRISNDLFTISEIAHHSPEDLFMASIMIFGGFGFMFYFSVPLALLCLIPLPVMFIWGISFGGKMRKGFRGVRKKVADINSNVENSIQGIREVQSFTNEDHEIRKFHDVNKEFRVAKERMYTTMAGFHAGMQFFMQMYTVILIGGGSILIMYGKTTLPDLVAFLLYQRFIIRPIQNLINFVEQYQQGVASFERFTEIMDIDPDITDAEDAVDIQGEIQGFVKLDNVRFRYKEDSEDVLKDISMEIKPGSTVALVGESGAGKSTIAALLPRFYEPQKGEISIDNVPINKLKQRFLRETIGVVQQSVFLFDTTIGENIAFGNPGASETDIIEAAKHANLYDFILSLPDGLDTLVGERGVQLSGGQKQRVSIARVFLKNPAILVFDEATSSLDTESESLIKESMIELCKGRSTLIIAHRLSTVKHADYTYVLKEGKVVEHGVHDDLIALKGYYYDLYSRSSF
jgi:ATP-binding cassette, subfamily B, bacterial